MTTLMIKDLAASTELDRKAMASVRGGFGAGFAAMGNLAFANQTRGGSGGGAQANQVTQQNTQTMEAPPTNYFPPW